MKLPSIYRFQGRWWYGGFNSGCPWATFWWMLWNGKYSACWQWPELVFGFGSGWYDGPYYFIHCGFFSVDLWPD